VTRIRNLFRLIHLWLGLSLGVLIALLGLTGALLVFYIEIDAALNPGQSSVQADVSNTPAGWDSRAWDDVLATAREHFPESHGEWSFEVTDEGGAIPARFYPNPEHKSHHAEREMVWFSADGKRVVRSEPWGDYAMSWIYELHMHLLAGEAGRLVVGWGGLATLFIFISGLVTLWPRGSWRNALSFKRNAVPLRRLRDLHKHAGFWSLPLSVLLVLTGVLLALPNVKQQVLTSLVVAPDAIPQPQSTHASVQQIPLTQALAVAHAAMPSARLAFIDVPSGGAAPFRMRVQVPGDPHRRFPGSFVFVDQYSGRVLAVHDVGRGNASTSIAAWIRPIHDGSIAGLLGRVLAIVVGLLPTALLITGFIYWQKRRSRRLERTLSISKPSGTNT
jgi:uncharacterized iron-regulated membrane protein